MILIAPPIELRPYKVPLRPSKNLNALYIGEAPVLSDLASQVDTVDVDTDTRIRGDQVILQTNATQEHING